MHFQHLHRGRERERVVVAFMHETFDVHHTEHMPERKRERGEMRKTKKTKVRNKGGGREAMVGACLCSYPIQLP